MGAYSDLRLSVLGPIGVILDEHHLPKLLAVRTQGLLIYMAVGAALGSPEQHTEVFQIEYE